MSELTNELTSDSSENITESWLSTLPPELQKAESLGKFKDVTTLASSYLELEKSLTSRVAIPKENAADEEWHKFYSRIGLPENKRYTDNRAAEGEPYLTRYEEIFYNNGISKRQGEKLLEGMYGFSSELQKKQEEETQNSRNSNIEWLKNYYKDEFDSKMNVFNAALSKFGTQKLVSHIEESNYNTALIDCLVNVGSMLKSDSLVTGSEKPLMLGAESALKEIKRLESDDDFMLKYKKGHAVNVAQMRQLHEIAYNNK